MRDTPCLVSRLVPISSAQKLSPLSPRKKSTGEGLPGVLGNKGTLAKYRREQGNISQFLGTGEQNSKNYSTKTFGKCVGTWEHRAILEGNKDPPWETLTGILYTEDSSRSAVVCHCHLLVVVVVVVFFIVVVFVCIR